MTLLRMSNEGGEPMPYTPGQRVTIRVGTHTGRKATVLAPEQEGRVGVLVDGLADGAFRTYLTTSVTPEPSQ